MALLQRRRRQVRVTDGLGLLGELLRILLGGLEPVPTLVGLQGGRAEVVAHLRGRDRRDDVARDHLVGPLVRRPVGDRPAGLLGGLAGDGEDLGDLLGGEFAGGAGPGLIGEDRLDGPAERGAGLGALDGDEAVEGARPASPPESDGALGQADLLGDLVVAAALKGEQDEGGAWSEPGRSRDGVPQGLKDLLLRFGDRDLGSLTRHEERAWSVGNWRSRVILT